MATADFVISGLTGDAERVDLENALTPLSGVGSVRIDGAGSTVSVEYDPDFVSPRLIGAMITGAGYPVSAPPAGAPS